MEDFDFQLPWYVKVTGLALIAFDLIIDAFHLGVIG